MPTFQSIGIHPELRHRLVTESRAAAHSSDPSAGGATNDPSSTNDDPSSSAPAAAVAPAVQHQPVLTPQALLSRNPNALRLLDHSVGENGAVDSNNNTTSQPISLAQIQKLRMEVSNALIEQSANGKRIKRMHKSLPDNNNNYTFNIPGTIPALNWLLYEKIQESKSSPSAAAAAPVVGRPVLSTGCRKLDQAIALPTEYQSVSTRMMQDHPPACLSIGIPFGYVTQFSGPPASGKTQLALQLAAKAPALLSRTWYLGGAQHAQRLAELCQNDYNVLERTIFCPTTNEFQLLQHLAQLEAELSSMDQQKQQQQQQQKLVLLILDSCSACLSTSEPELMGRVSLTLRRLARHYSTSLATVLLNGTVANRGGEAEAAPSRTVKPALGRAWDRTADIHVWLEPCSKSDSGESNTSNNITNNTVIRAVLERHVGKRISDQDAEACFFRLTAQGIQDGPSMRKR